MTLPSMEIPVLHSLYSSGDLTPEGLVETILEHIGFFEEHNAWITLLSRAQIGEYLKGLEGKSPASHPLYGIPFAIKDNIDLAGVPTTAACEAYTIVPDESATVVKLLIDAGAIPLGKTNLDQFATGLVGTRSPEKWGTCKNAFDTSYISGGSSSGSAVALALGLVSFALGTDTAGSGRVPAAFSNLLGLKPSRGLLSTSGVVPACRSLDCVSIFSLTAADAEAVFSVAARQDSGDAYSRSCDFASLGQKFGRLAEKPVIGTLAASQLETFGDDEAAALYYEFVALLEENGFKTETVDFSPFAEAARLLYEGPWVAERYIATREYLDDMLEVTRAIIGAGNTGSAVEAFEAQYRLQELAGRAQKELSRVDAVLTPTAARHFTIEEVNANPVELNTMLGYYTNFLNLLDCSAVAVPAGFRGSGLPFGVTLFASAFDDINLLSIASAVEDLTGLTLGATSFKKTADAMVPAGTGEITVAVCGAHLEGFPLNWQLSSREGRLLEKTETASCYSFYALAGGPPFRPGLIRDASGAAIDVELWAVPARYFGSFVAGIPQPLGIGKVELADGRWVTGFICEGYGIEGARDITALKGWRQYMKSLDAD